MKYGVAIFCFLAMWSQSFGQTGRTVWTKGGHTSAVNHLYFDNEGILRSACAGVSDPLSTYNQLIKKEAFVYGWDIEKRNIEESYYSEELVYIPWDGYSETRKYVSNKQADFSQAYIAGHILSKEVFSQSHTYSITDKSFIIILKQHSNQRVDSIPLTDTNSCLVLHPLKNEIAYQSGKSVITVRDFITKETKCTVNVTNPLAIEYSLDGNSFAVTSRDSGLSLWDAKTGELLFQTPHESPVYLLHYSDDTKYFIAVDSARNFILWKPEIGQKFVSPTKHQAPVTDIASVGVEYIFSSLDSTISFSDLPTPLVQFSKKFKSGVTSLALRSGDLTLAVGLENGDIEITNFVDEIHHNANRKNLSVFQGNSESVSISEDKSTISVKFSNVENRIGNYQLLNFENGNLLKDHKAPQLSWGQVESNDHKIIAFVRNDSVFTAPFGDTINLNFITKVVFQGNGLDDVQLTLSPDAKTLAVSSVGQKFIKFWDVETKNQIGQIPKPLGPSPLPKNSFSPDGTLFITNDTTGDFATAVWSTKDFSRKALIPADFKGAKFSPDKFHLAFIGKKSIMLWDLVNNRKITDIILDTAYFESNSYLPGITDIAFSPDSRYIAIAQKKIYLVNIGAAKVTHILENPKAPEEFSHIDFSKDGRYLVSAGKSVRLWDLNGITSVENEPPVLKSSELLKVFPNPSTGIITLELDSFKNISGSEIRIYNSLGILLKTVPAEFVIEQKLDCSELPGGLYFVELSSQYGVFARTSFIIAH
jgi:WD40 repeat protein